MLRMRGACVRLWKIELQTFADATNLVLHVHHLSAGHVEMEQDRTPHVMPYHAVLAWPAADGSCHGRRVDRATTTQAGLTVACALDTRTYEKGIKVSDAEMDALNINGDDFHPAWNYAIMPRLQLIV
jgi:hypothetical protein